MGQAQAALSRPRRGCFPVGGGPGAGRNLAPGLRESRVLNAMVGVTGEGNGDGIAGAPADLFHPVQVLGPRSEEGNPT